jgi:hypothetical protein
MNLSPTLPDARLLCPQCVGWRIADQASAEQLIVDSRHEENIVPGDSCNRPIVSPAGKRSVLPNSLPIARWPSQHRTHG